MANVCSVVLEFLRKGPPHNQLLSPLTDYLGVCGNNGAATVHVPYEHEDFLPKLRELRYAGRTDGPTTDRQMVLNKTAEEMSEILASVPGFISELCASPNENGGVTHLSLVLSAAELSLLPFELAKVPRGCPGGEGNWLLLQTLAPVCLTRQVRSVSNKTVQWPRSPKILFIAAAPQGMTIPLRQHTQALLQAIMPWIPPFDSNKPGDLQEKIKSILTVVPNATIEDIENICSKDVYTHVHVLAHGMEDKNQPGSPYGVAFASRRGKDKIDIVSGKRLATALRPLRQGNQAGGERRPAVVTVASCDSGHVNDIVHNNGASFAHELHQSGVPLVIASQFPLSFAGSIYMTQVMYEKLLWGEDPRIALHQLRGKLYALHASDTHDWASLVAYAALPDDLDVQLQEVKYIQAHKAIDMAMKHIDAEMDKIKSKNLAKKHIDAKMDKTKRKNLAKKHIDAEMDKTKSENLADERRVEKLFKDVDIAASRLPTCGCYETEGTALLASTEKRKAEAWHRASLLNETKRSEYRKKSFQALRESYAHYEKAFLGKMAKSVWSAPNRNVLHWVLCQYLSLGCVLGEKYSRDHWSTAVLAAEMDLEMESHETRAWAHSSLAELYLLLTAYEDESLPVPRKEAGKKAIQHCRDLVSVGGRDSFQVYATRRQFQRYTDWWGSIHFENDLKDAKLIRRAQWRDKNGVEQIAKEIVNFLPERSPGS